ncbi:uncharacterized protein BDR25DRAFT_358610 [Lindgomyces ingoldianus]|uniref:Uncharacterized protein n=1 Tax=Lindgomyces ingoldianus TaxID=673940 RepID=A0ACB6QKF7_9PLEO|nr:uncharacterized protein BDR25DRAFT_358610 [Lindgomyces ingoldianus]KAF2467494.1 hypothetical protein BDR25DRAFT_358610 [Lindgomyces ingoldianus]
MDKATGNQSRKLGDSRCAWQGTQPQQDSDMLARHSERYMGTNCPHTMFISVLRPGVIVPDFIPEQHGESEIGLQLASSMTVPDSIPEQHEGLNRATGRLAGDQEWSTFLLGAFFFSSELFSTMID